MKLVRRDIWRNCCNQWWTENQSEFTSGTQKQRKSNGWPWSSKILVIISNNYVPECCTLCTSYIFIFAEKKNKSQRQMPRQSRSTLPNLRIKVGESPYFHFPPPPCYSRLSVSGLWRGRCAGLALQARPRDWGQGQGRPGAPWGGSSGPQTPRPENTNVHYYYAEQAIICMYQRQRGHTMVLYNN